MGKIDELIALMNDLNSLLDGATDSEEAARIAVNCLMDQNELIETPHEMDVLCEHIVRHQQIDHGSDDVLAELLSMLKVIAQDLTNGLEKGHVLLSLIFHLGMVYGVNVFRKLGGEMDSVLLPFVLQCPTHRVHFPAVRLMYEVCLLEELSLSDLNEFTAEVVIVLFDVVERTSQADHLEEYNYDNIRVQRLIIRFLYIVLKTPETSTLFYTNDLKVILDVVLRESRAVAEEQEEVCGLSSTANFTKLYQLQQGYLNLLPPLLHNPQLQNHKLNDVSCLLAELRRQNTGTNGADSPNRGDLPSTPLSSALGNSSVRPSTRRVAERVFLECRDLLLFVS
ncbi:hypothetical protein BDR26DRAFT_893294 [Obelidium mucronatum]|nr:hypothetical protein BDR26DRAFT_893294 [Obelidium mucronatum]